MDSLRAIAGAFIAPIMIHELLLSPTETASGKIAEELTRLDVRAEERQRTLIDPFSSEMIGEVEGTMKTLSPHERVALRLLLKYGDMTDRVNAHKVREKLASPSATNFLYGLHDRTANQFPGGSCTRWSPAPFTAHCYVNNAGA